jgi:hypothetical protein
VDKSLTDQPRIRYGAHALDPKHRLETQQEKFTYRYISLKVAIGLLHVRE